jgi:hypothetical protein
MINFIEWLLPGLPVTKERRIARELTLKFSATQPRAPKGDPRGGQWIESGGDTNANSQNKRFQDLEKDAKARVDALQAQKSTRFGDVPYLELSQRRDQFLRNMDMAKLNNNQEDYDKWKSKRDEAGSEIQRRQELGKYERRLKALQESMTTGKLTVSESEMAELLYNKGDTYYDNKYIKHKFGRSPEYNPDFMRVSDLSGKNIRFYVTLPDGRIAHPDELIEAQARGRIVVYR